MGRTGGGELNERSRRQHCRFLNHEGRRTKSTTLAKAESRPTRIWDLRVRHGDCRFWMSSRRGGAASNNESLLDGRTLGSRKWKPRPTSNRSITLTVWTWQMPNAKDSRASWHGTQPRAADFSPAEAHRECIAWENALPPRRRVARPASQESKCIPRRAVVLERIAEGGAVTLDAYLARGGRTAPAASPVHAAGMGDRGNRSLAAARAWRCRIRNRQEMA